MLLTQDQRKHFKLFICIFAVELNYEAFILSSAIILQTVEFMEQPFIETAFQTDSQMVKSSNFKLYFTFEVLKIGST